MQKANIGDARGLGQRRFARFIWVPALAGGGLVAAYLWVPGLIPVLAVVSGLALAVAERVRNWPTPGRNLSSSAPSGLPLGDGGCFPGGTPPRENAEPSRAVVLDGGSLEHKRERGFPQLDALSHPLVQRPEDLRFSHRHE